MMNYEIFKEVVKEKFMDYMPDSFKGMELIVRPAEKVNMTYDAINIRGKILLFLLLFISTICMRNIRAVVIWRKH